MKPAFNELVNEQRILKPFTKTKRWRSKKRTARPAAQANFNPKGK